MNHFLVRIAFFRFFYQFDTGIPELIVAIGLSGMPSFVLARSLTAPITGLRAAIQELGAGDLAVRTGSTLRQRKDEIGLLVGDFDDMAERIESMVDAQERLIGDIPHELRPPLARLNLALELARRHPGF